MRVRPSHSTLARASTLALLLAACSPTSNPPPPRAPADAAPSVTWRFDEPANVLPREFEPAYGAWQSAADTSAPSAPGVIAQTARSETAAFNLVLVAREQPADVDLSVSLRAVAGEIDQGGGVVWRARDDKNYYLARYNPLEENCRVYKVVDGKRQQLADADVELGAGWHRLRVRALRQSIECSIDGNVLVTARDGTFEGPGRAGLWTKADAQTHFDDFSIGPNL